MTRFGIVQAIALNSTFTIFLFSLLSDYLFSLSIRAALRQTGNSRLDL